MKASYKDERKDKEVTVRITEEANTNEKEWCEIVLTDENNFTLEEDTLYIQNKNKPVTFTVILESKVVTIPKKSVIEVSFDKEVYKEIRGDSITIYPIEDCRMKITVGLKELNCKQEKEYIIKVEQNYSTFL